MRFLYTITDEPSETGGYNVTAFTEGQLRVEHGGATFLVADDILLVEFAVVLHKWLLRVQPGRVHDLYYASMNFEEEPIFAFRYNPQSGNFLLESVWAETEVPPVSRGEALSAAEHYLAQLRDDLSRRLAVSLDGILDAAVADDLPNQ
jgi:hypothetical protein